MTARSIGGSMAHILVIEDNPLLATIVQKGLEHGGHSVRMVGDGRLGLDVARETRFDLILLDVLMPGMDGFAVLKHLKADPVTAAVPVFMLTAQSDGPS